MTDEQIALAQQCNHQAAEFRRQQMGLYSSGPFTPIEYVLTRDGLQLRRLARTPYDRGTCVAFLCGTRF